MHTIKKSIHINAPLEEVFAYLADPGNLPEIWPSLIEVKNVVAFDSQRSFEWAYKMAGTRFEGRSETVEFEPKRRVVIRCREGIPNTLTYTFQRVGNMSRVSFEIEYEIPARLLERLGEPVVRRINEHEAGIVLHNLKDRIELFEEPLEAPAETSKEETPEPSE